MKKSTIVIVVIAAILVLAALSGCGKSNTVQDKSTGSGANNMQTSTNDNGNSNINSNNNANEKAGQNAVNFKCEWKSGGMKNSVLYVLKGNVLVVNPDGKKVWLDKNYAYMVNEVDGKKYLIKMPASNSGFSYDEMLNTYEGSKMTSYIDCQLNVVTEDDMKKPDYEVITMEELMNKKIKEAMG